MNEVIEEASSQAVFTSSPKPQASNLSGSGTTEISSSQAISTSSSKLQASTPSRTDLNEALPSIELKSKLSIREPMQTLWEER